MNKPARREFDIAEIDALLEAERAARKAAARNRGILFRLLGLLRALGGGFTASQA